MRILIITKRWEETMKSTSFVTLLNTRLSFAGTTSGIGGRVPPRKVACLVTISLQENTTEPERLVFIGWIWCCISERKKCVVGVTTSALTGK